MRRALEFLFTRVLRSRLGIALVIAALIFGIIGAARLVSGPIDRTTALTVRPREPISTVDPEAGDDGVSSSAEHASPGVRPGELTPEQTATRFTAAWLKGDGITNQQWLVTLRPFSTPDLIKSLIGVDPSGGPARETTGPAVIRPGTSAFVEVLVPLDNGRLRLELIAPEGRWLVDTVDWERE